MGIRGADRAIAVCDWLRELLPLLLAASANSPFLDGRDTGLQTVRSEIFTRTFPRCGIPELLRDLGRVRGLRRQLSERCDRRVDPALVERAAPPRLRHRRGADLRRADRRRGVVRAARLIAACVGADGARLRRARLRRRRQPRCSTARSRRTSGGRSATGWTGELIDFRRGEVSRPARRWRACSSGRAGPLGHWGSRSTLPDRNGAQRGRACSAGADDRGDLPRGRAGASDILATVGVEDPRAEAQR